MCHLLETKGRKFIALFSLLFIFTISVTAQDNNPLINSGELLKKGNDLHDQKKYKEAIALYKQICRSDSGYSNALYELSMSCEADSQFEAAVNTPWKGLSYFLNNFQSLVCKLPMRLIIWANQKRP